MHYFKVDDKGEVVEVADSIMGRDDRNAWQTRHDFKDFAYAERIAASATKATGKLYTAIDNSASVWPRFDVAAAPAVGEPVSYGFNGDYYPDGEITHVTEGTLRVVKTSTGSTYYRHKNTGKWTKAGGTWSLVHGHRDERNPHF